MKLLLFLLCTPLMLAQGYIPAFGDTASLKNYNGSGIVILEQYGGNVWDETGGGLFHYADSSTSEGSNAFDHPISGKQWVRIGSVSSPFTDISATTIDVTGNITLENDEILKYNYKNHTNYVKDTRELFFKNSINFNVADNDHLDIIFKANDDSSGVTNYGSIIATATDVSDESEDSKIDFKTFLAGTEKTSLSLSGNTLTFSQAETIDNTTNGTIKVTGIIETTQLLKLPLHTKTVGDSALGRVFLDAADTTLKAGTGTDLVTIQDLAP